jgi:hypothetical protein
VCEIFRSHAAKDGMHEQLQGGSKSSTVIAGKSQGNNDQQMLVTYRLHRGDLVTIEQHPNSVVACGGVDGPQRSQTRHRVFGSESLLRTALRYAYLPF